MRTILVLGFVYYGCLSWVKIELYILSLWNWALREFCLFWRKNGDMLIYLHIIFFIKQKLNDVRSIILVYFWPTMLKTHDSVDPVPGIRFGFKFMGWFGPLSASVVKHPPFDPYKILGWKFPCLIMNRRQRFNIGIKPKKV